MENKIYFEHLSDHLPELKARFNSFVVTAFDDSMTVEMQLRALVKWIKKNIELTNEMVDYLNKFIDQFDENLYKTVKCILDKWYEDGVLNDIILEVLADIEKRLDDKIVDLEDRINCKTKNYPIDVICGGADPTGLTPINDVINKLIKENPNRTLLFPKGEYLVDVDESILIENTTIDLLFEGAVLKSTNSVNERYYMFKCVNSSFSARGGKFVGDRMCHQGTTGEWGYCFAIQGCHDVYIENNDISMFWGDGIGIYQANIEEYSPTHEKIVKKFVNSNNVNILNNNIYECRRQGISVMSVENCYIRGNKIHHINGTAPQCAIDVEPNSDCIVKNVFIEENELYENLKSGVDVVIRLSISNFEMRNVNIINNYIHNNKNRGIFINRVDQIKVSENAIEKNIGNGIVYGAGKNGVVNNNIVTGNTESGIMVSYSDNIVVSDNNVFENMGSGINLLRSNNNSVSNNLIHQNGSIGINATDFSNENIIIGNRLTDNCNPKLETKPQNKTHIRIDKGFRNYITNNMCRSDQENIGTKHAVMLTGRTSNTTTAGNDFFHSSTDVDVAFPDGQQNIFGYGNRGEKGTWKTEYTPTEESNV